MTAVVSGMFRQVLGHFCTGITVVTAMGASGPVGFACQSFAALSLDPPLVLFCPARTSRTWPVIESAGRFCVNVLAHDQQDVSTVFGRGGPDKFASVRWQESPGGSPLLAGVLAWLDCTVETVHEAGDHYVVIGRVVELCEPGVGRPLLYFKGGYTVTEPAPVVPLGWPLEGDWI
jgi:3-hydroxy-9,10-secoandrosta-1,3,5(10)-triene-9,17-dione monooxygenase reductase component